MFPFVNVNVNLYDVRIAQLSAARNVFPLTQVCCGKRRNKHNVTAGVYRVVA